VHHCNGRIYAKPGGKLAGNTKKGSKFLLALYFAPFAKN
jgi:hypothetical protein